MANRIKVAIAVSILTLRQQGWSFRRIAKALGVHRETVARYVRLAQTGAKPATNLSTGSAGPDEPKPASLSAHSASLGAGRNSGPKNLCEPFREAGFIPGIERSCRYNCLSGFMSFRPEEDVWWTYRQRASDTC